MRLCAPRRGPAGPKTHSQLPMMVLSSNLPAWPQSNFQGTWDVTDWDQGKTFTVSSETRVSAQRWYPQDSQETLKGSRHPTITEPRQPHWTVRHTMTLSHSSSKIPHRDPISKTRRKTHHPTLP